MLSHATQFPLHQYSIWWHMGQMTVNVRLKRTAPRNKHLGGSDVMLVTDRAILGHAE
jgi:hypothetical protein